MTKSHLEPMKSWPGRGFPNPPPKRWTIEYDNDTGPADDSFSEWWTVTDGEKGFRCSTEADAEWLLRELSSENGGES